MNDTEIVAKFRSRLAERIGPNVYEVWFASASFELGPTSLTVGVPHRFQQDLLRRQFRDVLEAVCFEVLGKSLALEFRVDAAPAATVSDPPKVDAAPEPCPTASLPKSNGHAVAGSVVPGVTRPGRRFASLESFVVGPSNKMAFTSAELAVTESGRMSPLVIHGPSGVGKTRLLEGIWRAYKQRVGHGSPIYLSAEQFTSYFVESFRGSGLPSFRRKYRDVTLLLIDDIQFFAGKRGTTTEFVHTLDSLARAGRQVVLSSDRAPSDLKALGPELLTRLAGAVVCRIEPAEYATRLGIVRQLSAELAVPLPEAVAEYIAERVTSQARELSGAIKRLHAASLAHGREICLALAEESLAELVDSPGRIVKLADIERAVCDVFGLEPGSLHAATKERSAMAPRMLAMWLARKHTRAPLSQIGEFFGRRSHSTVISAEKKIRSLVAGTAKLADAGREWNVEDTIRRVEARLHAG